MTAAEQHDQPIASPESAAPATSIRIRGARTHNLRGINLDIPHERLTVITGVSGSGKSSLAFHTIYPEGRRRYLESLGPAVRSWIHKLPAAKVDQIDGLPPTICIDQRPQRFGSTATLATITDIHEHLRLLYARAGIAHCTSCGKPVHSQTVDRIIEQLLGLPERTRLTLLAPLVVERKGAHADIIDQVGRRGFVRVRVDGEVCDATEVPPLDPLQSHCIDAVVDRLIVKPGIETRLRESAELCVREGEGRMMVLAGQAGEDPEELFFSTRFSCAACHLNFPSPEPRNFNFRSAWGACPACEGRGARGTAEQDEELILFRQEHCPECRGTRLQAFPSNVRYAGVTLPELCQQTIEEARELTESWLQALETTTDSLTSDQRLVSEAVLPDIVRRLDCLRQVGLRYPILDRNASTLSVGEAQRARLATALGAGLSGACYLLDEPTNGLHPADIDRLIQSITNLRDCGATVIAVEHDREVIQAADHLVDLGPGAGTDGGQLLGAGPPATIRGTNSPTGQWLTDTCELQSAQLPDIDLSDCPEAITLTNAARHNLKSVTVRLPLRFPNAMSTRAVDETSAETRPQRGCQICVTGVSGSGKSTLIMETLVPLIKTRLEHPATLQQTLADTECEAIIGGEFLRRIVIADGRLPGRSARSCPATITGLWSIFRKLLAKTRDARAAGYTASRFSLTGKAGTCPACTGTGEQKLRMEFLTAVRIPCPTCRGARFNSATLQIRFGGRSAADLLHLRIDEAADVFSEFADAALILKTLCDVGLGYMRLGQPATEFSGGEAQRLRLATELAADHHEPTLYLFDEPTSGLHAADIARLLKIFSRLQKAGHTLIIISHHPVVMCQSDWIIDLGPEGGPGGGRIVAIGSPAKLLQTGIGKTADAIRRHMDH